MSKKVQCDTCGATDDWADSKGCFFTDGASFFFHSDTRGEVRRDICSACMDKIFAAFPNLKEEVSKEHR